MHLQIVKIWKNMEKYAERVHGYQRDRTWKRGLVNNNAWWGKVTLQEFLGYLGSNIRVGTLLGRDT
jgi:tyrosyl-tRNA synthetase